MQMPWGGRVKCFTLDVGELGENAVRVTIINEEESQVQHNQMST